MSEQKIGQFNLLNQGGFVTRMDARYRSGNADWTRIKLTGDILLGQNQTADPGDHGVPDGADVRLEAHVQAGTDKQADQVYTYKRGNNHIAKYVISGVVTDPTLALVERT